MKKLFKKQVVISLCVAIAICAGALYAYSMKSTPKSTDSQGVTLTPYVVPPLSKEYRNDTYNFSVSMPDTFSTQEFEGIDGEYTVVLQDSEGQGIQIMISPSEPNQTNLTADDIRAAIPDMSVTDEQSVEIGDDNTGVAFKSNNEAFSGDSREVWFYFRGNLYQISTYARLDTLLQSMFGTWNFF